jgi:hypothetical protein
MARGFGPSSGGINDQRNSVDQFGNSYTVKRLNLPKKSDGHGGIEGLLIGYVEIGGKLYEIAVTGANTQKSDRHRGWMRVTHKQKRQGGGGL